MLTLSNISKTFGGVQALSNVCMTIEVGEVKGLIGPNGAGKTTLLNLISGLLTPSSGSMSLDGVRLDSLDAASRARIGVARTFQNLRIFQDLTVAQNIDVALISARASGQSDNHHVSEAIERFDLADKLHLEARALSYGHMRRLEIVRALALSPKILMLDEPAAGMNEKETHNLGEGLAWVSGRLSGAMLVIDHDLKFMMSLSDRITVLNMGRVIANGSPRDVTTNPAVLEAYLGEEQYDAA